MNQPTYNHGSKWEPKSPPRKMFTMDQALEDALEPLRKDIDAIKREIGMAGAHRMNDEDRPIIAMVENLAVQVQALDRKLAEPQREPKREPKAVDHAPLLADCLCIMHNGGQATGGAFQDEWRELAKKYLLNGMPYNRHEDDDCHGEHLYYSMRNFSIIDWDRDWGQLPSGIRKEYVRLADFLETFVHGADKS